MDREYLVALAMSGLLILNACSSGGNDLTSPAAETTAWTGIDDWPARLTIDNDSYVGSGVIERLKQSPRVANLHSERHDDAWVYHSRYRIGVGRDKLIAYLENDAEDSGGRVRRFGDTPPIVKVRHGTSDQHWHDTRIAVQMINAALPNDWQLRISTDRASRASDGEIVVFFGREQSCSASAAGCASSRWIGSRMTHGDVWVDPTRAEDRNERLHIIIHEILHVMGRGHPDPYRFPNTLMTSQGSENSGFILYQLDREALLAVHDRLEPGTPARDVYWRLGPWEDTSTVTYGYLPIPGGAVRFGAAEMNDHVQAWSYGPTPWTSLEDNPRLLGSATWRGRLLGMTPASEVVGGAASLQVHLWNLEGNLDFTALESWSPGAAPGVIGTGNQWLDGDLHYPIEVSGNSFWRTWESGDDGKVVGSFFGIAHEGMGGVLKRDDLSAGFGGRR